MSRLIPNADARLIFLDRQGLSAPPNAALGRDGLLQLIEKLGFVQVDSIGTVERAHHQILFSRNQTYKREHLSHLLEKKGDLFEHWTHDAAIIPSCFLPYWKHRFEADEARMRAKWADFKDPAFEALVKETYDHIEQNGAVMARDFKVEGHVSGGWWNWHPNKSVLEYLWRAGKLAIARREGFQKVYDLAERVFPAHHHANEVTREEFVDWCCRAALDRLGFANPTEMAAFLALISIEEAKAWVAAHRDELEEVAIETVDGSAPRSAFVRAGDNLATPEPPARIRVLSPFDPLLRDRARAERLFGFSYRIEVFVPEPKRQYGYYVFPLLEGDRMIGRIDMKAERKDGVLDVKKLWLEPGVRASTGRLEKLDAELRRLAKFTGVEDVRYRDGWV